MSDEWRNEEGDDYRYSRIPLVYLQVFQEFLLNDTANIFMFKHVHIVITTECPGSFSRISNQQRKGTYASMWVDEALPPGKVNDPEQRTIDQST